MRVFWVTSSARAEWLLFLVLYFKIVQDGDLVLLSNTGHVKKVTDLSILKKNCANKTSKFFFNCPVYHKDIVSEKKNNLTASM